ncbi:hypothetical protein QPK87_04775 [Kamptonema cortianum]|nr:hypothetical protein [Geitlerinema splendidum]MDK3155890.1 hypothetical protein [Kamptonema cortianum]
MRLRSYQAKVRDEAARFNVLACGRRWGKTWLGCRLAVDAARRGRPVAWGAPNYKYLREPFRFLRRELGDEIRFASWTDKRIELKTGGSIDFWTLSDSDAGRGMRYKLWIIDEAAMVRELEVVFLESIRPTLSDLVGDAWFLSTPKGRGFFYQCFLHGQNEDRPEWRSWQRPTSENSRIAKDELLAAEELLPHDSYRQEYLAEFCAGDGTVFRDVLSAIDEGRVESGGVDKHKNYRAGVDLARLRDYTVITVLDEDGRQVWFERMRGASWESQIERVKQVCERFGCDAVVDASGLGDPIVERLVSVGVNVIPYRFTALSKESLVQNLTLKLERGQLRLMDLKVQTDELIDYQYVSLAGGLAKTGAPPGGHDDCVMALALAAWGSGFAKPDVWVGR